MGKISRHYIIIFGRFFFFLRLLRWPKIIGGGMGAAENKNKRRLKIKAVSKDVAENNQPRYLFYYGPKTAADFSTNKIPNVEK